MVLDAGPLLRGEVGRIDIDYMLVPQTLDGIVFDTDAHVVGSITDNACTFLSMGHRLKNALPLL